MRVRYPAIVLAACSLAAPCAHAREAEIRLTWNEARTVIDHIEPRSRLHVWSGADGKTRSKGKLVAITETEVTIENRNGATSLDREHVHSIKVFPARTHAYGNRKTVAILSVPIACGSFLFTWAAVLGISDSDTITVPKILASIGGMLAVPVAVWQLARRADRGSIRIILKDTAAGRPAD